MKTTLGAWLSLSRYDSSPIHPTFQSNLTQNLKKCRLQVQRLSQRSVEFDLEGVDAPIANAIRRVLIAEVHFGYSYQWGVLKALLGAYHCYRAYICLEQYLSNSR